MTPPPPRPHTARLVLAVPVMLVVAAIAGRTAAACPSCGGGVATSGPGTAEPWGLVGLFLLVPLAVAVLALAVLAPWRPAGANPPSSSP